MDPLCDFCGEQRAMVYCRSDTARLCFPCDAYIHAANALSRRHLRAPVCDRCGSQPAIIRCLEDKVSLCQNCDRNGCLGIGPAHRRHILNCYSGCPSLVELSKFWSCILDSSPLNEEDGHWGWKIMPPNESSVNNCLEQGENSVRLNGLDGSKKLEPWMSSSSEVPNANSVVFGGDPQVGFQETNLSKVGCPPFKDLRISDDDFCEGFNVDDVGLSFENSDELFGCSQSNSRYPYEDVGMDGLLMEKKFSVGDSDGPNENITEASSSGQHECMTLQSSRAVRTVGAIQAVVGCADQVLFNLNGNSNINLSFPSPQVSISLSVSNLTGESNAADYQDYQDCGVSPILLTGESPWDSNLETSSPQARDKAKMRYNEKKKSRMFGKCIRYASRKIRADTRKRVKGRFVNAGEAYDYDPLVARSC